MTAPAGRRFVWFVLWLACSTQALASEGTAPADAYFGRLKMSPLQIRLKIDDLARAYHSRWTNDHDIVHDAVLAEDALRAWRDAYPRDPWLGQTAFHLEQLYQALQTQDARSHATALLRYVVQYWPASAYGRSSRARLAQGFPKLHAESAVRPTPNPYARRTPAPTSHPAPRTSNLPSQPATPARATIQPPSAQPSPPTAGASQATPRASPAAPPT